MDEPEEFGDDTPESELLRVIAGAGPACARARRCGGILYHRYAPDLYRYSMRFGPRLGGADQIEAHVQEVMLRALCAIKTFSLDPTLSPASQRNLTFAWLKRIAINVYIDSVRRDKGRSAALRLELYDLKSDGNTRKLAACGVPEASATADAGRRDRAVKALAELSERDQDVLLVSLDWYDRMKQRFVDVPSDVITALCERYAITADNYRQIRDRALKKMRELLLAAA